MVTETTRTLAFLFTDLESSTQLWEQRPVEMRSALARHDAILRSAVASAGGSVVKTTGDGLMAVFHEATAAVAAAAAAQRGLAAEDWQATGALQVRMGVHWGPAQVRDADYFGPTVNRTARIMAAGHGGQVLLSADAGALTAGDLPAGTRLRNLGEHRLKDLINPERLFQLVMAGLPDRFPPLDTLDRTVNNLPTQSTVFLGRAEQLAALRALLDDPTARLVSLTGPGGTGKTRLVLQAAADQVDRYLDGVYFVDLSPDHDADAAFERIVRTVSVTRALDAAPLEALKADLAQRHVLLVLDNCEQVGRLGPAVAQLLAACPQLRVLATSREVLHVSGEHPFPVPPLALPLPDAALDDALDSESVRLFSDRAQASQPEFVLDDRTVADVVAICRRLDGLPLALELAAARLRLFSPAELHARLGLQLLTGGPRDLPDRQRTLRSTIDWSYELLDLGERQLFELFSVFADADVAAVEEVAGRCGLSEDVDVVDALESLIDKSLLRPIPGGGSARIGMLQTIRDYAREKLAASGAGERVRAAHAQFFADRVAAAGGGLSGKSRPKKLIQLETDLANSQEAWRYFLHRADTSRLDSMLEGLWALYQSRGWYHGSVDLAGGLLEALAQQPETPQRVHRQVVLQTSLARALMALKGYTDEVEAAFDRALDLSTGATATSPAARFPVLRSLAALYEMRTEFQAAVDIGRELLSLATEQGDPAMLMDGHLVMGASLAFLNKFDEGLAHLDAAIELYEPAGDPPAGLSLGPHPGVACMTTSALLLLMTGCPEQALARAQRADEESRTLAHPFTRAYTLFHTAFLDLMLADLDQMDRRADELLLVANANDYSIWRAVAILLQSISQIARGDAAAGVARMEQAMTLYQSTTAPPVFWPMVLSIRASGLMLAGRPLDAVPLVEEALSITPEESPVFGQAALDRADVMLAVDPEAVPAARELYNRALRSSRDSGVRWSELRAATRLHRIATGDAERREAATQLRAVFDTFTEGFGFADLQAAAAELAAAQD